VLLGRQYGEGVRQRDGGWPRRNTSTIDVAITTIDSPASAPGTPAGDARYVVELVATPALMQIKVPKRGWWHVPIDPAEVDHCLIGRLQEARMQTPLEICFKQMESSPTIETRVRQKVADLERLFDRITSCRVPVKEHRQHHSGIPIRVHLDIGILGRDIAMTRPAQGTGRTKRCVSAMRGAATGGPRARASGQGEGARGAPAGHGADVRSRGDFGWVDMVHRDLCLDCDASSRATSKSRAPRFVSMSRSATAWKGGRRPPYGLVGKRHLPPQEP